MLPFIADLECMLPNGTLQKQVGYLTTECMVADKLETMVTVLKTDLIGCRQTGDSGYVQY